jgi:Fe-S-cluster-containing hydrogenase component 2
MINHDKCVGCRMCFSACPFGAVEFDALWGKSVKCDLCGGDLECVSACKQGALVFTQPQTFQNSQMLQSALRATGGARLTRF